MNIRGAWDSFISKYLGLVLIGTIKFIKSTQFIINNY